ncbi:MAG: oligosaccharide flippase family protein [Methanobacteriota archaeon]
MIARKSFLILVGGVAGALFGLVAFNFIARFLGPVPIGSYSFALAILTSISILGDLGIHQAHMKRVSEGRDLSRCVGAFVLGKIGLIVLMTSAALLAVFFWEQILGRPLVTTNLGVIMILLAAFVVREVGQIAMISFDANRETARTQIAVLMEHFVRIPVVVAFCYLVYAGSGAGPLVAAPATWTDWAVDHQAEGIAIAHLLGMLGVVAVALSLFRDYPIALPDRETLASYFRFALPYLLYTLAVVVAAQVDRLIVGYYYDQAEVGYYFSVQRITSILLLFPNAVWTLLFPTISALHAVGDRPEIRRLLETAERYSSMTVVPFVVFLVAFPSLSIAVVLSADFLPAAPALRLLGLQAFALALIFPLAALVAGLDRPALFAKLNLFGLVANVLLNLLLVPDRGVAIAGVSVHGATGAALATLVASVLQFIAYEVAARSLIGKAPGIRGLRHWIAAGASAALLYLAADLLSLELLRWYHLVAFGTVHLVFYASLLVLLRELAAEELRLLRAVAHPVELLRYVRGELRNRGG